DAGAGPPDAGASADWATSHAAPASAAITTRATTPRGTFTLQVWHRRAVPPACETGAHERSAAPRARPADRHAGASAGARRLRLGPRADPRLAGAVPRRGDLRARGGDRV